MYKIIDKQLSALGTEQQMQVSMKALSIRLKQNDLWHINGQEIDNDIEDINQRTT